MIGVGKGATHILSILGLLSGIIHLIVVGGACTSSCARVLSSTGSVGGAIALCSGIHGGPIPLYTYSMELTAVIADGFSFVTLHVAILAGQTSLG